MVSLAKRNCSPYPDLPGRLQRVLQLRDGVSPPPRLPRSPVPASWRGDYAAVAAVLDLDIDYPTGRSTAETLFADALTIGENDRDARGQGRCPHSTVASRVRSRQAVPRRSSARNEARIRTSPPRPAPMIVTGAVM